MNLAHRFSAAWWQTFLNSVEGRRNETPRRRLPVRNSMMRQVIHRGRFNLMPVDQSRAARVPQGTPKVDNFSGDADVPDEGTPASRPLADAIQAVQLELGQRAAKLLARITGQSAKTARRQMTKPDRMPNGAAVFLMATDPIIGVPFLRRGARRLKPDDRRKYWNAMAMAALDELRSPQGL